MADKSMIQDLDLGGAPEDDSKETHRVEKSIAEEV